MEKAKTQRALTSTGIKKTKEQELEDEEKQETMTTLMKIQSHGKLLSQCSFCWQTA
jgi:uncharacterized metal-binding protein